MFPIRDSIPRVHTPYVVYAIIILNSLVFLWQQTLSAEDLRLFLFSFGVVPARFTFPEWAVQVGFPPYGQYAFFTHLFLHGSFSHFLVNMWSLWIFGDNIEDVMGSGRFIVFYFIAGLAATLAHMFSDPNATIPVVGASGAIAGVMGAYFLLYPHSKVSTLLLLIIIPVFVDLPAVVYLGIWFGTQLLSGVSSLGASGASIAWWAHIGGFAAGIILVPLFKRKGHCYYCRIPDGSPPHRPVVDLPEEQAQNDSGSPELDDNSFTLEEATAEDTRTLRQNALRRPSTSIPSDRRNQA